VPNTLRSENTFTTSREQETPARGGERVTAAVGAGEKQEAVAARVNRHQAAVAAAIARARDKQEAVAARVNRHQAAAAAEVRARQAAAAEGRDSVDRSAQIIPGVVFSVVRGLVFPYQLGRRVVEPIGSWLAGRTRSSTGPV
jgi:hypothetical protein